MFRNLLLLGALVVGSTMPSAPAQGPPKFQKRPPLLTSRVVGSPDPPPPYRKEKVYPALKVNFPIHIVRQPGSDLLLFVGERNSYGPSAIYRMKDDPKVATAEKLLDLPGQGVAYDIIFHPKFAENGFLYVGYNGSVSGAKSKRTRIARFRMDPKAPYTFDAKSEKIVIEWDSDGHNGGAIAFGHDGMLYVTSGDGTSDSDTNIVGQDMSTLLAKVLRIDVDRPDPAKMYSVPKDNPFINLKGARTEIWAYGLRNPWRMTVDKETGHLWVAQNGQDLWEQAYLVKKGENYGWSITEGSQLFYPNRKQGPTPIIKPTVEHHHREARSLTGGVVYYGKKLPELRGAYIYGDYSTGKVWAVKHDGKKLLWHKEIADTRLQITFITAEARGELLICDHRGDKLGGFYTLVPTPQDLPPSDFPRKLSDSGLFKSVKGHAMEPALVPYQVIAPLWGDNAYKERWIGLPGKDRTIGFNNYRGWDFPDKTVIVKSFALEMEEGNPASRRWIETRFFTRQEGEWFGYSYAWNDEQAEGTLVESKGRDREFLIKTKDGQRKQTWHFPSRAECMVCHSRAANWVLGLSTRQMNLPGQLEELERQGVFRTPPKAPDKAAKLVDPYDAKADITLRARSYLQSNCAHCHVEAGGGNAQINLEYTAPLTKMNLIDVKPQHDTFGLKDAKLIAPGSPERSVLLHRMSCRGPGQMPPLATSQVDREAVEMMREWIRSLKPGKN